MDVLARFWMKMASFYGKLFTSRYGDADDTGLWYQSLQGLTERDIEYGVSLIVKAETNGEFDKYPPTPAEFKTLCRKNKIHGLPSAGAAFDEAERNASSEIDQWSHPLVRIAASKTNTRDLRELPSCIMFPHFAAIYERVCREFRLSNIATKTLKIEKVVDRQAASKHLTQLKRTMI